MKREELAFQKQVVQYLRLNRVFVFSVPNGVYIKSPKTRADMQASGLTAGISDLFILLKDGKYAAIELKTESGRQSSNQHEFESVVLDTGGQYEIWRTLKDAENWLKLNKNKI